MLPAPIITPFMHQAGTTMSWRRNNNDAIKVLRLGIWWRLHVHKRVRGVCAMMKVQQLSDDAVKLWFVPFALRDNAKKWLYSLATNSITMLAEFVTVFLKKFFPMHKAARIWSEINQFRQREKKLFWRYLERFKDLVTQCPYHTIEKWHLYQITYEGVDCQSKTVLESMSHGDFMKMIENDAWNFFWRNGWEEMAENTCD